METIPAVKPAAARHIPGLVVAGAADAGGRSRTALDLGLLTALTLALHAPFLRQAFHIDDVVFLDIARNVFRNPWFPLDLPYVVEGQRVNMWGFTHPPLNSYLLAGLLWLHGGSPFEVFLHSVYLVFPLLATVSFYFLARRFVRFPLAATALFACTPVLVVMAHTLMADVPLLAAWLCGTALFIHGCDRNEGRYQTLALVPLMASVFMAYQGLALIPLWGLYAFERHRLTRRVVLLLLVPVLLLFAWQLAGDLHEGSAPSSTLFRYLGGFGLWLVKTKIKNAVSALCFVGGTAVLFPFLLVAFGRKWRGLAALLSVAVGLAGWAVARHWTSGYDRAQEAFLVLCFAGGFSAALWAAVVCWNRLAGRLQRAADDFFLSVWLLGVLTYCALIFTVGAARYVLPAIPPLVLLLVRAAEDRVVNPTVWRVSCAALLASQLVLGVALARADYQVAGTLRQEASDFGRRYSLPSRPFFFSGEWGFRYYMDELGGQEMARDSVAEPGELVVKSRLCLSQHFDNALDRSLKVVSRRDYRISSRLRTLDPDAKAGFWSDGFGMLPFWFSGQPLDEITVYRVAGGDRLQ